MTRTEPAVAGIAVIDKPPGWTSHQVVGRMRRIAGTRRVGHAGTLDPMATGVLVVGIERATRLLGHLTLTNKSYRATVRLGASTVTDDAEGEMIMVAGAAGVDETTVRAALPAFTGDIEQVPSAVSAIKVDGVRSYARVRGGEDVTLPARPVRIDRYDLTNLREVVVDGVRMLDGDVEVDCSSGTYIRALARDLGAVLGTGGHLTALRRTRVGPFALAEAQDLEAAAAGLRTVSMADVARRCFAWRELDPDQARDVTYGRRLVALTLTDDPTAVLGPDGTFLALYRADGDDGGDAVPVAVFVDSASAG